MWGKLGILFSSNKVQIIDHCTYIPVAVFTEEERKIILAVMDRQKKEEEKEQSVLK